MVYLLQFVCVFLNQMLIWEYKTSLPCA